MKLRQQSKSARISKIDEIDATISMSNITLRQLSVLAAVVDTGGFTAAAQKLGITQSAASQALITLEAAVCVELVSRGGDVTVVTEIGSQVLADAREALRAVERLRERCANSAGLPSGTLRIGSVVSAAARLLPTRLRHLATRYPAIRVVLMEGTDEEVSEWAARGIVDLGLTGQTLPALNAEVIAEDEFVAIVGAGHPLALARAISIPELAPQPFIMSSAGCEPAIRSFFSDARCSPNVAFTVRDMATLFEMVRQEIGVSIVPSLCLPKSLSDLGVRSLRPSRRRKLFAVTRADRAPVSATVAFLELMRGSSPRRSALAQREGRPGYKRKAIHTLARQGK